MNPCEEMARSAPANHCITDADSQQGTNRRAEQGMENGADCPLPRRHSLVILFLAMNDEQRSALEIILPGFHWRPSGGLVFLSGA
jgi:hypothetical protein